MGGINGPFTINNAHYDMDVINERVPFNNTEIWQLTNQTPIAHPFHIHNVSFYVLTVNGNPPPAHMRGRKDVVIVPAGMGVVRFITKFEDFYNDTLPYMYHCHMLTHEDDGMMGQFIVKSPCNLVVSQPNNINTTINSNISFTVTPSDTNDISYQWQTNNGTGFINLQNAGQYTGVTTNTLSVNNISTSNNNQQFRCLVKNLTCETFSVIATLTVGTVGTNEVESIIHNLHPNPASSDISLHFKKQGSAHIKITNLVGQTVIEQPTDNIHHSIDISGLNSGVYFILVEQNSFKQVFKFIKH